MEGIDLPVDAGAGALGVPDNAQLCQDQQTALEETAGDLREEAHTEQHNHHGGVDNEADKRQLGEAFDVLNEVAVLKDQHPCGIECQHSLVDDELGKQHRSGLAHRHAAPGHIIGLDGLVRRWQRG